MRALLVSELEKDLLSFGVLEPLAVLLEELVRPALAFDPDEQRLKIVDALAQLLRPFGEQTAGRAFEEQERRMGFQLRILVLQLAIALFEDAQVVLLFGRELLVTETGFADEIAAAAGLLMGQADEAVPMVLVRGLGWSAAEVPAAALIRPAEHDLFR